MTKEETVDGNVLIAEYMGVTPNVLGRYNFPGFGYMTSVGNWKDEFQRHQLKFHKDWNWSMEACIAVANYPDVEVLIQMRGDVLQVGNPKEELFKELISIINQINEKKKALLEE
jgi:hypothetical protein